MGQDFENKKLMRILERVDLDKPILMHDKLEIIWDKNQKEKNQLPLNLYNVKMDLEKIKAKRNQGNKN